MPKAQETLEPRGEVKPRTGKDVIEQLSVSSKESIWESFAEPTLDEMSRCHSVSEAGGGG